MNLATEIKEGFFISLSAIRASKLRSGLTTLGVVIGIVTVTLMGTAIEGLNGAFKRSMSSLGTDVLYIQRFAWFSSPQEWWRSRNRREITIANVKEVARHATLALAVSVESQGFATLKFHDRNAKNVWVVGNNEEGLTVRGLSLQSGRFMSGAEVSGGRPVCVLGDELARKFFPYESPLGKKIKVSETSYEVIGVIEKMGQFFTGFNMDNQVIIPITRFTTDLSRWPDVTITVKVRDPKQMEDAKEELIGIMRKIRRVAPGAPDDFAINQQDAIVQMFNRVGGTLASLGLFITGLSLFVGGIGIMNIMFVSVAERTREIGVRKAIGAKRRTIMIQFLIEAAVICLFGGLIGLAIAFPVTFIISKFLPATLSLTVVGIALVVSILTGVISGFLPAWRAAKMNPVDALRSE